MILLAAATAARISRWTRYRRSAGSRQPRDAALNPLTLRLLQAPIVPLIFKLAWPNMMIMLAQAGAALVDTWWLAKLGNDALAGMVLVFPFVLLVGTVSGGSIGAGHFRRRRARARRAAAGEAEAVLMHGLIINVVIGGALLGS